MFLKYIFRGLNIQFVQYKKTLLQWKVPIKHGNLTCVCVCVFVNILRNVLGLGEKKLFTKLSPVLGKFTFYMNLLKVQFTHNS